MNPEEETPDIVVLGASAGGVAALQAVISALPEGLDAAVFAVLHLPAKAKSLLPGILSRAGKLPAAHPWDGELFETGRIYPAPPDRHIVLHKGRVRVVRGPKENLHRPAIDVLFRSAATAYGRRVIGALLTGGDDDGAAGLKAIQERGGVTIVQDPNDSAHPEMPQSALKVVKPDFTLPLKDIGSTISGLVTGEIKPVRKPSMAEPVDRLFGQEEGLPFEDG